MKIILIITLLYEVGILGLFMLGIIAFDLLTIIAILLGVVVISFFLVKEKQHMN